MAVPPPVPSRSGANQTGHWVRRIYRGVVSMDSTQLERGALESKDRDELTTIANALGGKPGSRARKAEIVDLILDLTGTGSNGSSPDSAGSVEEPPAEWEVAVNAEEATVEKVTDEKSEDVGDDAESSDGGKADTTTDRGDGEGDSVRADSRNSGQDSGRQNQSRGQHQNRGQQSDQSEPGNRRRRRRGRERDQGPEEPWDGEPVAVSGHLDLRDEGYGFLRTSGFKPSKSDAYVSVKQVRQFGLRKGDQIVGASRPANRSEKNPALLRVDSVNGADPEKAKGRPKFEDLTPLFPDEKLKMEVGDDPTNMTARIIDLLCPVGKGQRGMIVSPPKAGKTTIVKSIVRSIETNHPEVKLIVLLVDERPEEVTDMRRWMLRGEVVGSTFDRPSDEHTHLAEVTIERAKRMVEYGEDVVIVLDGITRLSRAYNLAAGPGTGRIMSGGLDTGALYPPKRFFGAARNVEEGGSLTILATALVDTGSKMDEVIFEEFKGTGNMELRLDRRISERRIYPAIDVNASSTRHEELLFERKQLNQVWKLRRVLNGLANDGDAGAAAGLELLIDRLKTFNDNDEFLVEIAKGPSMGA
ncbi:MAG: transcription termination factor Rho [Acidimicrobiaceae bacterium]|nr:transcription termination factor Rho [Acidimicrobiaceae bacterium]